METGSVFRRARLHGETRRTSPAKVALAAGLCAASAVLPVAAGAATSHRSLPQKTDLQKGKAFYQGKTINFVSPASPGGGFDQWARLVAPELASYLHATVNVSNIPAGNTVAGQDFVAHAAPDGLTVGWMNAGPDIENTVLNLPALNFNPLREAFLGATAPGQTAIVVLNTPACSQWTNFDSLISASSSSNQIGEVLQTTGTGTFFQLMVNTAFGIHFKPITGYQSTAAQSQGFQRGDGCLSEFPAATADPLVKGGKARAIMLSVPLQAGAAIAPDFAGVPTLAQEYAKKTILASKSRTSAFQTLSDVAASTRIFFAPAATQTPERDALEAAFQAAMKNPTLISMAQAEGNPVGQETGAFAKTQFAQFLKDSKREVPVLQSVIG